MKRKRRHTNRNIFLMGFLLVVVLTVTRRHGSTVEEWTEADGTTLPKIGINHLISDDQSESESMREFEHAVENFMTRWEIVGASVAVMKDGQLIYSHGFGYADREQGIRTNVSHIFRIASLSKLITAVAVMKLYEEDRLGLEDRVFGEEGILNDSAYCTIRDKRVREITVEHLLRHRAGYSIRAGDPLFESRRVTGYLGCSTPVDFETMIRYAASTLLRYRPGGSNVYSNLGYVVLTKVVEKVSGMPYEQYVREKILAPTGCYDMHIGHSTREDRFANEVSYYEPSDALPVEAYDGSGREVPRCYGGCDLQVLSGAGGWVASPTELLRFISAIDSENPTYNLLRPETIRLMTASSDDEYPIGWMRTNKNDDWSRSGSLAGTSAMLQRQSNGYTWVLITNTSSWNGSLFPSRIAVMMKQAMQKVESWPDRDLFSVGLTRMD